MNICVRHNGSKICLKETFHKPWMEYLIMYYVLIHIIKTGNTNNITRIPYNEVINQGCSGFIAGQGDK